MEKQCKKRTKGGLPDVRGYKRAFKIAPITGACDGVGMEKVVAINTKNLKSSGRP